MTVAAIAHRPGRVPSLLNFIGGLLIIALLLPLALHTAQPPPPPIAEFAPQAQTIKEPPKEQLSNVGKPGGNGDGTLGGGSGQGSGGGGAGASPVPLPSHRAIDLKRVRHCVGNPPRQIEDPQSPPCVPYFDGENGGATSKGVTGDIIKVAIPTTAGGYDATRAGLYEQFFNSRFEFYGRKIKLFPYGSGQTLVTPTQMEIDAGNVDRSIGPFADIGYSENNFGGAAYFYDSLARRGILSLQGSYTGPPSTSDDHLESMAPYEWNYTPSAEKILRNEAEMICHQLAGKAPTYGGPYDHPTPKRVFGIMTYTNSSGAPVVDPSPLENGLKACTGTDPVVLSFDVNDGNSPATSMVTFKADNVTTIISLINGQALGNQSMPGASGQGYHPEWFISELFHAQDDIMGTYFPDDQSTHVIGLRSWNKSAVITDSPYWWALKEIDPTYNTTNGSTIDFIYWNLLALASGIQMAGPHLTPATFEQGLFKTRFPNPNAGQAPYFQARVGFSPRNRSMIQDFAMIWFSRTQQAVDQTPYQGGYCYVAQGARFGLGLWPVADPAFQQQPCR